MLFFLVLQKKQAAWVPVSIDWPMDGLETTRIPSMESLPMPRLSRLSLKLKLSSGLPPELNSRSACRGYGGVTVGDQCGAGAGEIILGCQFKFFKKDK